MKTICGMSTRGAAFFGASVHICVGFIFFLYFFDRLVHQMYYKNFSMEGLKVDKESVIYFGLFLPLGILIFKAVDKENKTLLKWSTAVFLTLQLFGVIMRIKFGPRSPTNQLFSSIGPYPTGSEQNFVENFKNLSLEIIATISYLITLYLYGRQLECFPGRIYSQGGAIPLYSPNSTFFPEHSQHPLPRGMNITTPFTYTFEPPPPYSSVNNLASSGDTSFVGLVSTQQQPCSSRSILRGSLSFKKSQQQITHHAIPNLIPNQQSHILVVQSNDLNSRSNTNINPSDSDSPSAPLLEGRQNDLGVVSDRRPRTYCTAIMNLTEGD